MATSSTASRSPCRRRLLLGRPVHSRFGARPGRLKGVSAVRLDCGGLCNGCRVLRIESDVLCIDILPELGGKIYRWLHKPDGRDWLWQHPTVRPARVPAGAGFDDAWCGGWDDLFPCDAACERSGLAFPDHGEYWYTPFDWDASSEGDSLTLGLRAEGSVTPTRMERWITVQAGTPAVRIRYRLTHRGGRPFEYFWRLHPALPIRPGCEILIPAGAGVIASPGSGRLSADRLVFQWPYVPGRDGRLHDLGRVPADGVPDYEMVWLAKLRDGWFAVADHDARSGFGVAFDKAFFTNVWLFQTFGGWRGLHVAVVEPCTADPYDRPAAGPEPSRQATELRPGDVLETEVTAVVFTGRDSVEGISRDGCVW